MHQSSQQRKFITSYTHSTDHHLLGRLMFTFSAVAFYYILSAIFIYPLVSSSLEISSLSRTAGSTSKSGSINSWHKD